MNRLNSLVVGMSLILGACTKIYRPTSDWEKREYGKANRSIYPKDALQSIGTFKDSVIVWPGIIRHYEIVEKDSKYIVELYLEHHYYDWLLDNGSQTEKIFLSPQGEGNFRTKWVFKEGTKKEDIEKNSAIEDLVLVYGKPAKITGDTILVNATYIKPIQKKWYSTKYLDYGRN